MINIDEELDRIQELNGFCTPQKAKHLYDLMISERPKLTVEVGVYGGRSLFPLALGAYRNGFGRVVGIDMWTSEAATEGEPDVYTETWKTHNFEDKFIQVCEFARREPYSSIVEIRRNHLVVAADDFDDESIGIFHEDGNHSKTVSQASVKAWVPKVKSGGIFIFDDPGWNGDTETEDMLVNRMGLKLIYRNSYIVLRKL